jgi:hypothetical protein
MAVLYTQHYYQGLDDDGAPLNGGLLYTYSAGTLTPKATYTTAAGNVEHENPIELDSAGRAIIFIDGSYKFVLHDANDVPIGNGETDNITAFNVSGTVINDLLPSQTGNSGKALITDGADAEWGYPGPLTAAFKDKIISGFTISNNVADATNDIDIAVGYCVSDDGTTLMSLGSAYTKRLDATWAVGTGQGGLDTGSIANASYFVWVIHRTDTSVTDILFSTSATAPSMPANYTKKKRIGSILRESATIVPFVQYGKKFMRKTPVSWLNTTTSTSAALITCGVPVGVKVKAILSLGVDAASTGLAILLSDPDVAAVEPSLATGVFTSVHSNPQGVVTEVVTDTSGQIRWEADVASRNADGGNLGWEDYQI